ncbi:hypothetical protein MNB_SV-6-1341 [hydrothermal vent metagenome]|uniref:Indole-3-glycerol-phosphate synthase n=1 Tax=hydrothermal vent metagenome TaxID=652676 RepID=A0A1W1BEU7_9ZZZZ
MLIVGDPWIEYSGLYSIKSIDDIKRTPPNSIVLLDNISDSIEVLKYTQREGVSTALRVDDIKSAIYAHLLSVKYIISPASIAKELQSIAQNYLFDSLIMVEISDSSEIESYAKMGIDGVILPAAIKTEEDYAK